MAPMYPSFIDNLNGHQIASGIELEDLLLEFRNRGMSENGLEMMDQYIRSCWDKGVSVVLDPGLSDAFGTYNPDTNTLTLGESALDCNIQIIETLEHEFIHVLQDEMAGIHNADLQTLGLPTTEYGLEASSSEAYSHLTPEEQALEAEAFSVEELIANPEAGFPGVFG